MKVNVNKYGVYACMYACISDGVGVGVCGCVYACVILCTDIYIQICRFCIDEKKKAGSPEQEVG